jgi:hypothetical protein
MSRTSLSIPSPQTARLTRGGHASPEDGAYAMELASMLAGEAFSDHPKSVCRVIAAFLRWYNDAIDDDRRRDLYRCVADVVGTRASRATERARLAACENVLAALSNRHRPRWLRRLVHVFRSLDATGNVTSLYADLARALSVRADGHARALMLVDELVAIDAAPEPPCRLISGRPMPRSLTGPPTQWIS